MNWREVAPGLAVAATVAIAATFLSLQYKASAMLFALLLGMASTFSPKRAAAPRHPVRPTDVREGACNARVAYTSEGGGASVGASWPRWESRIKIVVGARPPRAKARNAFGTITGRGWASRVGGLAIDSILPSTECRARWASRDRRDRALDAGVILYHRGGHARPSRTRTFLASIHDVEQVVGGLSVSPETGDAATIVTAAGSRSTARMPRIGVGLNVRGTPGHAAPV